MSNPLTERQFEVLRALAGAVDGHKRYPNVAITPMLCRGRAGSHHSTTLAALCKKDLAVRKRGVGGAKCEQLHGRGFPSSDEG